MNVAVLADLLEFTRDGEWGEGEAGDGLVEVGIIRGTDFSSVRYGDLSGIPTRYVRAGVVEKKQLRPGDVLIETAGGTKDQPTGRTVYLNDALFQLTDKPLLCASFARFLRVREGAIDPKYLFWKLQDEYLRGELLPYHVQHTGVARFQYTQFAATHRLVAPDAADEQNAIASVLSALDDKIQLNRRMNETLDAMAQAIFKDWFVDFGPVKRMLAGVSSGGRSDAVAILGGLIADPVEAARIATLFPNAIGGDGLPEGWENSPFSRQIEIVGGGTPKTSLPEYWDGDIPWFSVTDTPNGSDTFVFETEKTITEQGLANSSAKLVEAGTTIITARGTVGNLALAGRDMTFNQSCYALRARDGESPYYVYLSTKQIIQRLQSMAHGSVFSTITRHTFENVEAPLPPRPIRDAFEGLAAALFDRIKASVQENRTLAETRDYLLPKLMSGAVRVRDAEKAVS